MRSLARLAAAFVFLLPTGAAADPAAYYRGETLRLVVGYGTGGGYDTFARLIAPELAKALDAKVVVENRPGGGGLTVLNEAMRLGDDGMTLTVVNVSAAVTAQLLRAEPVRFDVDQFRWLGGVASDERVLLVPSGALIEGWTATPQTPETIRWAAGGETDNLALSAALLSEALQLSARIITGYSGTSEAVAGVVRGEADATVVSIESAAQAVGPDTVRMAAVIAAERAAMAPEVPTIYEVAPAAAERHWLDYLVRSSTLGRAVMLPPATPEDRVAYLAGTLQRILTDPAFVEAAADKGRAFTYVSPAALAETVRAALLDSDPELRAQLVALLSDKYF